MSWNSIFSPVPLSLTGKPIMLDDEVEVRVEDNARIISVEKEGRQKQDLFPPGTIILTNLRLIFTFLNENHTILGWGFSMSRVIEMSDCSTYFSRSTRVSLRISDSSVALELKFSDIQSKEVFIENASRVIQKKSWEDIAKAHSKCEKEKVFSVSNAGVSGIIRRHHEEMSNVDKVSKDALSDLDALMKSARDVVEIVQRYAKYAQEKHDQRESLEGDYCDASEISSNTGPSGGFETMSEKGERNEMESILLSIGIVSPVTKYSAGRRYHHELSRELADILLQNKLLERLGGMVTLTDLYYIVNRARGTELVSPDDFLKAAESIDKIKVGIRYKCFKSGVKVLHLASLSTEVICQQLLEICRGNDDSYGINAGIVSRQLNVTLIVAKEYLLQAESDGTLCRDESTAGLYFFENKFERFIT
jgi:ESCRT-II complex subunit VPS36